VSSYSGTFAGTKTVNLCTCKHEIIVIAPVMEPVIKHICPSFTCTYFTRRYQHMMRPNFPRPLILHIFIPDTRALVCEPH
jgi:hypothetical protein